MLAKAGNWRQNKRLTKLKSKLIELQRFSINVHPRLEDVNLAYKDLVLYRKWTRVAILYTGKRDGRYVKELLIEDPAAGSSIHLWVIYVSDPNFSGGASTLHLQHLLLQNDVDCLTRNLPPHYDVSIIDMSYMKTV